MTCGNDFENTAKNQQFVSEKRDVTHPSIVEVWDSRNPFLSASSIAPRVRRVLLITIGCCDNMPPFSNSG